MMLLVYPFHHLGFIFSHVVRAVHLEKHAPHTVQQAQQNAEEVIAGEEVYGTGSDDDQ